MLVSAAWVGNAQAEYIANIEQVGSNVVVTGSGTLDLTGLSFSDTGAFSSGIVPAQSVLGVGAPSRDAVDVYSGFSGPANFGSGGGEVPSDSGTGDKVAIEAFLNELAVPAGYVSGTSLADSSTYDNATFASLGLTPGTYVYSWNPGPTDDTFVINVGVSAVPVPGTLPLFVSGLLGFAFLRWKSRGRDTFGSFAAAA